MVQAQKGNPFASIYPMEQVIVGLIVVIEDGAILWMVFLQELVDDTTPNDYNVRHKFVQCCQESVHVLLFVDIFLPGCSSASDHSLNEISEGTCLPK